MKTLYLAPLALLILAGCQQETIQTGHGGNVATNVASTSPEHFDSIQRTYHLKDLQRVTLKVNGHDVKAWVMDDNGKREEGMMFLTADDVSDDDGMIFVFSEAGQQSFWMKNTLLALDITYISPDKKVLNVQPGKPGDLTPLPSKGDAQYVLEMKQGSAARLGIKPGVKVEIPNTVKSK